MIASNINIINDIKDIIVTGTTGYIYLNNATGEYNTTTKLIHIAESEDEITNKRSLFLKLDFNTHINPDIINTKNDSNIKREIGGS